MKKIKNPLLSIFFMIYFVKMRSLGGKLNPVLNRAVELIIPQNVKDGKNFQFCFETMGWYVKGKSRCGAKDGWSFDNSTDHNPQFLCVQQFSNNLPQIIQHLRTWRRHTRATATSALVESN